MGIGWKIPFCKSTKSDLQKGCIEEESEKKRVAETTRGFSKLKLSSDASTPRTPLKQILKGSFMVGRRCGVCMNTAKRGDSTAVYTAECSHRFHFPCIAAHVAKHGMLVCPVCRSLWKDVPLLTAHVAVPPAPSPRFTCSYDDDEPLSSRCPLIPEVDDDDDAVFGPTTKSSDKRGLRVGILPSAVAVSGSTLGHETYVVSVRVQAPPPLFGDSKKMTVHHRAAVDLVTVLDVSGIMGLGPKLQLLKRAMRLVISSLVSTDRLCVIVFASSSKRLMPLIRMTPRGKRMARLIVDRLITCGDKSNASNAVKKATKVLEDRQERNPVATILLISDGGGKSNAIRRTNSCNASSTRFSYIEIPVDAFRVGGDSGTFTKHVGEVLSVVARDLRVQVGLASESSPAEIMAVYSCTDGEPVYHGSGSSRLGDLFAEEERELLVEIQVPSSPSVRPVMSLRFLFKDPATNKVVYERDQNMALQLVRLLSSKSVESGLERLRSVFVSTRAIAEARRLVDHSDYASAGKLLLSTKELLSRWGTSQHVCNLEHELAALTRKGRRYGKSLSEITVVDQRRHVGKGDPPTPSAWSSDDRLAKMAMMRNSLKRVSDLHGFEDARF